jgi:hypothetical protein
MVNHDLELPTRGPAWSAAAATDIVGLSEVSAASADLPCGGKESSSSSPWAGRYSE